MEQLRRLVENTTSKRKYHKKERERLEPETLELSNELLNGQM